MSGTMLQIPHHDSPTKDRRRERENQNNAYSFVQKCRQLMMTTIPGRINIEDARVHRLLQLHAQMKWHDTV